MSSNTTPNIETIIQTKTKNTISSNSKGIKRLTEPIGSKSIKPRTK